MQVIIVRRREYLCLGLLKYSIYVCTENKYTNSLRVESNLRIQSPNIDSNILDLVSKQQHRIHRILNIF